MAFGWLECGNGGLFQGFLQQGRLEVALESLATYMKGTRKIAKFIEVTPRKVLQRMSHLTLVRAMGYF